MDSLPKPAIALGGSTDPVVAVRVIESARATDRAILLADDSVAEARPVNAMAGAHLPEAGQAAGAGNADDVHTRIATALIAIEARDFAAAAEALDEAALPAGAPLQVQMEWADALARANLTDRSDAIFENLLEQYPRVRRVNFLYAKWLFTRGKAARAAVLLETCSPFPDASPQAAFSARIKHLRDLLSVREDRVLAPDEDCRLLAMKHAIAAYADRVPRAPVPGRLGRLSLITGSLGPGGAERQLSRTAAELERLRQRDGHVGGILLDQPIEVLVRSHDSGQQRDFFLSDLVDAQVELHEINPMAPQQIASYGIADENLVALLDYLPVKVNFGVRRLVEHFSRTKPDIVSLWQDGACLFSGLAALVAGVPKVQIMIRGLPPVIRKHMFQPDYEVFYRAMATVPGVEFISNSKGAAMAYAEWLDLPIEKFSILYNGVQKMEYHPSDVLDATWQAFCERTPGGGPTIGGVFRFDTDKRPLTWIRFAARYAKKHPDARFVLVGDGRLLDDALRLADELGVTNRILFVGRSTEVGYWMKKMDVLVLLSSFEGLPNVLIEAQYLGVPVVSTPAGGAAECFIEGVTGHILGCADKTDLNEACEKVHALLGRAQDDAVFVPATRDFLEPHFSVPNMLENFVRLACGVPQPEKAGAEGTPPTPS